MSIEYKALVFGAGMVTAPLVKYLTERKVEVTLATRTLGKAEAIAKGLNNVQCVAANVENKEDADKIDQLVKDTNVVISLLPWTLHAVLCELSMKHDKHFCTSSYVNDFIKPFDGVAKEKGVIILMECGVDPGLDHMSAKRVIDDIHAKGGKVVSFKSFCGGLPAPDSNNNPFGYKCSWSPRGVLLASRQDAKFFKDGEALTLPGKELFASPDQYTNVGGVGDFEGYPNRDSTKYREIYSIPEAQTLIRGTFRYQGWCEVLKCMGDLDLTSLDEIEVEENTTYASAMSRWMGSDESPREAAAKKLGLPSSHSAFDKMEWLGLFSDEKVPAGKTTKLDAVTHLFETKMTYAPGERDMIVMQHEFIVEYPQADGSVVKKTMYSSMTEMGDPAGYTAMAKTVTLPLAMAVYKVLTGEIKLTGIQIPVIPELYNPILDAMAEVDVKFVETEA